MATLTTTQARAKRILDKDPSRFADLVGGNLYEKQREMFRAVFSQRRVAVCGANGTGKDFAAARIMLAWLSKYWGQSKVIVTAPTWRQVDDIVWNEARMAEANWIPTDTTLGLQIFRTPHIRGANALHFAEGFAVAETVADRQGMPTGAGITGYHSSHLLVIISEAHAVPPSVFVNVRRYHPQCILLTGNPFTASGEFYDAFHDKRHLYYPIEISAFDTPNLEADAPDEGYDDFPGMVTKISVREAAEEWGEESALYVAGVLGQFPDNLEGMVVVPLYAAKEAAGRTAEPSEPTVLAIDLADTGMNKTVWMERRGKVARIVNRYQGVPTNETEGRLLRYLDENHVDVLVIDSVGLGITFANDVQEALSKVKRPPRLVRFKGGDPPHGAKAQENFADLNAQCWWAMRQYVMEEGGCIPDDQALIGQMTSRPYSIQSDKKIKLESKDKLRSSPDEADALAMTFAQPTTLAPGTRAVRGTKTSRWRQ